MLLTPQTKEALKLANNLIPVHSMWDGFWIHDYENGTLTISCSFDRIYYRDFDIYFNNVSFFNIPSEWQDTNVKGDRLFKLAHEVEFASHNFDFDTGNKPIYSLNLTYYPMDKPVVKHAFFIVADSIKAEKCLIGNTNPSAYYKDPFENEAFPCFKNRVAIP